ncbi:AbrB family transcriptional regulator [Pseudomonas oryzihabitans]|nr:AbrB family transcriptional regulator [Pseudomonas psychrotolerans]
MNFKAKFSWIFTLLLGALGGYWATLIGWPLPWVIGPLVTIVIVRCCGWLVPGVPYGRQGGQLVIAIAIGCHFTLGVMHEVLQNLGVVSAAIVLTLGVALLSVSVLYSWGRVNFPTAYFALMPANSTEMVHLARQRGGDTAFVAAAHSVRLLLILLGVPLAASFVAPEVVHASKVPVMWPWLLSIFPLALSAALLFKMYNLPNPWTFGPFLVCALVVGGADLHMRMPEWMSACGQVLVGCALGANFDRAFFKRAPAFLLKVLLLLASSVAVTVGVASILCQLSGINWLSLALGMMPGSAPEMSLTAEALSLAVALVTAMQITRMLLIQAATLPFYSLLQHYLAGGLPDPKTPRAE